MIVRMEDHGTGIVINKGRYCKLLLYASVMPKSTWQYSPSSDTEDGRREGTTGGGGVLPYKNDGGARWKF